MLVDLLVWSNVPAALGVLWVLAAFPKLTDEPSTLFGTALAILGGHLAGLFLCLKYALRVRPTLQGMFFVFTVLTATFDLGIMGYLCGWWQLASFYTEHGERYFLSAYGVAVLGWDGVFHALIQGHLACRCLRGQSLNPAGLVWAGSIINSMMPLLLGNAATGKFSAGVELSTALNAPYVLVPIVIAAQLFGEGRAGQGKGKKAEKKAATAGAARCAVAVASHAALVCVHVVQTMAVLGSDASVAKWWISVVEPALAQPDGTNTLLVQCVQFFFYFAPYHCLAAWEHLSRALLGRSSVLGGSGADWAALILGGYLQALAISTFMGCAALVRPGELAVKPHANTLVLACAILAAALLQLWAAAPGVAPEGAAKRASGKAG